VDGARREQRVVETFVALSDTLVQDFDTTDFLTTLAERTAELLRVSAAGVILRDGPDRLKVGAASSERSRVLEVLAVSSDAGPCIDCVRSGTVVVSRELSADRGVWPRFVAGADEAGFRSVHAVPMRLRGEVIGVLTLLHVERLALVAEDAFLVQALADSATIGLLHQRALRHAYDVAEQLQRALNSRVIIEQAKGVLAQASGSPPEETFVVMRRYARGRSQRLTEVATQVVAGKIGWDQLTRSSR
jgi:GAF domain-containing protein